MTAEQLRAICEQLVGRLAGDPMVDRVALMPALDYGLPMIVVEYLTPNEDDSSVDLFLEVST